MSTVIYVVTVTQGAKAQVVTKFHNKEAAREFISSLQKIVNACKNKTFASKSEASAAHRRTVKKLTAIHPRAVMDENDNSTPVWIASCSLV